MSNLVIVESPTKAKTIGRFLGKDYEVLPTVGHVRDLPQKKLGVDIENDFAPSYEVVKSHAKAIASIKLAVKKSDKVFLATDPDREGEAISWHISEAVGITKNANVARIVFHEITENAIKESLSDTRKIDMNLVNAQQVRRILDRIVGFKVSPVLWQKLRKGLSAGRVQSVATKLIVNKEKDIEAFITTPYWHITAELENEFGNMEATYKPEKKNKQVSSEYAVLDEAIAKEVYTDLKTAKFAVKDVKKYDKKTPPPPPFTTSTLQQDASRKISFNAQRTMRVAQSLYEGITIGEGDATGLITYMRTDSLSMSKSALSGAVKYIKKAFGEEYTSGPKQYKTKSKSAQEAHEAVRPTRMDLTPSKIKEYLNDDQNKLYNLIWMRAIASQMTPAIFEETSVLCLATSKDKSYELEAKSSIPKFDGWHKVYSESKKSKPTNYFEKLDKNDVLKLTKKGVQLLPKSTTPPPRYSEASLIRNLEEFGIGRPSTYASIIATIEKRDYARKEEGRFKPTVLGRGVVEFLEQNFVDFMDIEFTAGMEKRLDNIAQGDENWLKTLKDFYATLSLEIEKAKKAERFERDKLLEYSDKHCPKCEKPLVVRTSRYGQFLSCSGFPDCKTIVPITTEIKCPRCNEGEIVRRKNKNGKYFHGCTTYPKCDFLTNSTPVKDSKCPKCSSILARRFSKGNLGECLGEKCEWKGALPKK